MQAFIHVLIVENRSMFISSFILCLKIGISIVVNLAMLISSYILYLKI